MFPNIKYTTVTFYFFVIFHVVFENRKSALYQKRYEMWDSLLWSSLSLPRSQRLLL